MFTARTLKRYLDMCDAVLEKKDTAKAQKLQDEIIAVFEKDLDNIRSGLTNYSPVFAMSFNGRTVTSDAEVDYIADLKLLRNKLYVEFEKLEDASNMSDYNKKPKILISHSSADVEYIRIMLNLLEDIGLTSDEIVCSSIPGYGIPLGADIYDWLATQFQDNDLYIIFALSENYYTSPACLNEMGAAWVLKKDYDSILLPKFDFRQIAGAVNPNKIALKLDDPDLDNLKHRLCELKDKLTEMFSLRPISATKWERNRDEFISKIIEICKNEETENSDDVIENNVQTITKDAAVLLIYAVKSGRGEIVVTRSLSGLSVAGGKWDFISAEGQAREEARWEAAIKELEQFGLVEPVSYKRQIFKVTYNGFTVAEQIDKQLCIDCENNPDVYLQN